MRIVDNTGDEDVQINLMPLIDMVFLLLIFFLVASTFAKEERQLDINLPTSSAAQPLSAPPKQLVVNIDEDGVITVNGQTYSPDGLVAMIRESVERDSNREIFIRADQASIHRHFANVARMCRDANIQGLKIGYVIDDSSE